MEVIREKEIKLLNGESVKIITLKDDVKNFKRTYEILVDCNDEPITPEVKSISFDQEHQMFLVRDKLAIDEYLTGSIYYYINQEGLPIGLCFFDLKDGFYAINFDSNKDYKQNYFNYKLNLTNIIRSEVSRKTDIDLDNCKKMALYMKRVVENENKI